MPSPASKRQRERLRLLGAMAPYLQQPHDKLFRTVFTDPTEAAALLRAHLPESLAGDLVWSSLTLQDASFIDEQMRDSESDLLYAIEHAAGDPPAWLYLLLEHQSKPDRWMPFRLLKYCCRIWDRDRRTRRRERELRPIVPMVFYQGRRRWRHATEFSALFAPSVRAWPWVPRFEHLLFDQSQVKPRAVRGALRGRITQLMMMAAYRHRREALRSAARLLATLPPEAGETTVRMFVLYLLATQDRGTARSFGEELRGAISGPGGELMTYAEELIREGREQGRQEGEQKGVLKGRVGTIENLLQAGVQWSVIESATGIDQDALRALKQRLAGSDDGAREPG